jgi:hypothetical protein
MFIAVIAAFCFSYYFVAVAQMPMAIKKIFKIHPAKRIKPIDCVQCLSVWMAVFFYFLPAEVTQFVAVVFLSGFIGSKINK